MELAWAQAVCRYTGKPVLHLAPLAVSSQTVREAEKFGIPAHLGDGEGICVTNYQKLDHFDLSKFGAVILYESRSDERRVGKRVSVRVDIGGRRIIKTKKTNKQ